MNLLGIFNRDPRRKIHDAAFSGDLMCPYCESTKNRFMERITPYTWRYQCKDCKYYYHYDVSPMGHLGPGKAAIIGRPYAGAPKLEQKLQERLGVLRKGPRYPRRVSMNGQTYDVGVHKYKL